MWRLFLKVSWKHCFYIYTSLDVTSLLQVKMLHYVWTQNKIFPSSTVSLTAAERLWVQFPAWLLSDFSSFFSQATSTHVRVLGNTKLPRVFNLKLIIF